MRGTSVSYTVANLDAQTETAGMMIRVTWTEQCLTTKFSRKSGNHTPIGKLELFGADSSGADSGFNPTMRINSSADSFQVSLRAWRRLHSTPWKQRQRRQLELGCR